MGRHFVMKCLPIFCIKKETLSAWKCHSGLYTLKARQSENNFFGMYKWYCKLKFAVIFLINQKCYWSLTASVLFYSPETVRRTITLCKAQYHCEAISLAARRIKLPSVLTNTRLKRESFCLLCEHIVVIDLDKNTYEINLQ